jgi:hypothetical protein
MEDRRVSYRILVGRHERKNCLEDIGIYCIIILKWVYKKCYGEIWTLA